MTVRSDKPGVRGASSDGRKRVPRQRRRSKETRARLLTAAREAFAERGFEAPSIDDITERADLGKGTFYYYFESKDQLIRALLDEVVAGLAEAIEERCEGITDLPQLLDGIIHAHIEFFSRRWEDFVLYFQGRADSTLLYSYPGVEPAMLRYLACMESLIGNALKHDVPDTALHHIACAVAGFVSGYYSLAAIAQDDDDVDVDAAFRAARGAMVASLARFVAVTSPSP
jgi:AcrR family transcriptional regulator